MEQLTTDFDQLSAAEDAELAVRGVLSGQVRVPGQLIKALGSNAVLRIPGT